MATGAVPVSISATVDIGYGRGRLAPAPAASLRRIDVQLGRPADVNDAWRSPEVADANRAAWLAYQGGYGPAAPYALDRWGSIHCRGYATDSDDWYNAAAAAVWRRNGWRQTALYPVGDSRREPWHAEYDEALDEFLGQPAASSAFPIANQGEDMYIIRAEGRTPTLVGPGMAEPLNDEEAANLGAIVSKDTTVNARQFDLAVSAATRNRGIAAQVWGSFVDRGLDPSGNPVRVSALQELADAKTLAMQILGKPVADVTVDVDEAAIAASLAPLIAAHVGSLSDDDVRRLSAATADELAKRLSNA